MQVHSLVVLLDLRADYLQDTLKELAFLLEALHLSFSLPGQAANEDTALIFIDSCQKDIIQPDFVVCDHTSSADDLLEEQFRLYAFSCNGELRGISGPIQPSLGRRQQTLELIAHLQRQRKFKRPACSVIITSYNYAKYLPQAIESVLFSFDDRVELLVLDNASTDNTDEILAHYRRDPRVKIVINASNLGAHQNGLNGHQLATGDYLCFLCADDYFAPHFLQAVLDVIENHRPDLIFTALTYIDAEGCTLNLPRHPGYPNREGPTARNELLTLLTKDCYCPPSSTFYRRASFENIGGWDTSFHGASDWDVAVRLAQSECKFYFIQRSGVFYRFHPTQHTNRWADSTAPLEDHCLLLEKVLADGVPASLKGHEDQVATLLSSRAAAFPECPGELRTRVARILGTLNGSCLSPRGAIARSASTGTNSQPYFSVIVTTYNRPRLLVDTLRSIENQTLQDFEIILVNDCGEPVEHLLNQFSTSISLIRHGLNKGLSAARNTGLTLARGKYVVYLDDDDLMLPAHLETLAGALQSHPSSIVYTDADYVNETLEGPHRIEHARGNPLAHNDFSIDKLFVQNFIPVNTFCHPRSVVDNIGGFDESLPALEDWEFLLRLSNVLPFVHLPTTTVEVRTRLNASGSHMLDREQKRLPDLYRAVYARHPASSPEVRHLRTELLARFDNARRVPFSSTTSRGVRSPASETSSVEAAQRTYHLWRARTAFAEIDAETLAERMMLKWTKRPGIHLLMALRGGEEHLLADTLDSLAAQLYPDWLLTVVTDLPQPEGMDEAPSVQWLSLQDAVHIDYVIEEVAAASPGSWLARIDPGLTFEPNALQVIADYINVRPMWHLIYCDEDTREADGRFTQPLFKPDLNLDLLRAQNYFGAFVLVEKDAFNVVGRYGAHRGAEIYDLSLRLLDQVGPQSIGHIDQMLVHLPRESTRAMEPEAEKRAVVDHLQRRGLEAEVCEGLASGTRHVKYRWPAAPLVSIVIQTRDREEYLRPMLESLHELTAYSNYELIIVDNDTQDPDAVDWLRTLPDDPRWRGRASVLHASGPFNWAAGANAGARAARGDYLLFLDNDMHIVQPEWLSRLMSIAQRPEVGIVGPRLAFAETARVQETGWVLGLYGLASSPWKKDMELTDPGYMGRAVCDQEVGAVSGSALLVRSSVLSDVGGFDATCFPVFDAALDLCLRVREQGKSVVCTPYSMLVHYGGVSMHERQKEPGCALEDLLARKTEREAMLSRWLHRLANDPTYNKNLSLIEPFEPEHVAPLTWDTNFRERTRILGIPLSGGAGEYRLRAPLKAISRAGLAQTMICEPPAPKTVRILTPVEFARIDPDVIIFHQPVDDLQTESLKNLAKYLPGVRRIITIDDLITAVPKKNSFHKFGFKDAKPRLRKTLSLAERVVVSTEPLADFCRGLIDDIRIMPNCLEQAIWNGAAPPRLPRRKPRVGWAGAQQHLGDLELIYPVVEALANEVDWIFMGMCPDPLRPFVREFHDFVRDFEAYPSKLAQLDLDLAIAPLEINAFNEAKSNLRLLEYGFMGWPVICTDIFPYQSAPVTRLPNDPERWISTIREQLADPAALERSGQALREWVLANFILEDHATEWAAAYGR